jgi:hypothetical protein
MHAHTHLSHKYTYAYIYIRTYTHMHIFRLCYAQLYLHTWTPAHARAHTSAHKHARASAVPPRTTARAASTTRRARPACGGAPPGRKGGAYRLHVRHRRGVPRADVGVERRRHERLRAEPHAVDADGTRSHVSARMGGRPIAHAHTRARAWTQHVRTCERRARIGDPFI